MVVFLLVVIIAILLFREDVNSTFRKRSARSRREARAIAEQGRQALARERLDAFQKMIDQQLAEGHVSATDLTSLLCVISHADEFSYLLTILDRTWGEKPLACEAIRFEIAEMLDKYAGFRAQTQEFLVYLFQQDPQTCVQILYRIWPRAGETKADIAGRILSV